MMVAMMAKTMAEMMVVTMAELMAAMMVEMMAKTMAEMMVVTMAERMAETMDPSAVRHLRVSFDRFRKLLQMVAVYTPLYCPDQQLSHRKPSRLL
jgi:hypothetical protein